MNFIFELEKNNEIKFLVVLIKRVNNNKLQTRVYWKSTSSNIYLNWNAHAPTEWKVGTLRSLIKQAKLNCSYEGLVKEEMKFLTKVSHAVSENPMLL